MLLIHWDRHASRAAQGTGVKEGFPCVCFICLLSYGYTEHIISPLCLYFSEAQILIMPTVIYQIRTLFFSRPGGLVDSQLAVAEEKEGGIILPVLQNSDCSLYCTYWICFRTPLISFHLSSETCWGFLSDYSSVPWAQQTQQVFYPTSSTSQVNAVLW